MKLDPFSLDAHFFFFLILERVRAYLPPTAAWLTKRKKKKKKKRMKTCSKLLFNVFGDVQWNFSIHFCCANLNKRCRPNISALHVLVFLHTLHLRLKRGLFHLAYLSKYFFLAKKKNVFFLFWFSTVVSCSKFQSVHQYWFSSI